MSWGGGTADTLALGANARKSMGVQISPPAQINVFICAEI